MQKREYANYFGLYILFVVILIFPCYIFLYYTNTESDVQNNILKSIGIAALIPILCIASWLSIFYIIRFLSFVLIVIYNIIKRN